MRLDRISRNRGSLSGLPRRDHLDELKNINAEYLAHFTAFTARSQESSDISYELQALEGKRSRGATARAGIWHEGRLAGVIGYDLIDWENRTTEVGYWLGEEHRGKGLVTAACRASVEHAFGELSLNRVGISCATENKKSCAIPERLGFRREGVQRQAE